MREMYSHNGFLISLLFVKCLFLEMIKIENIIKTEFIDLLILKRFNKNVWFIVKNSKYYLLKKLKHVIIVLLKFRET